MKKRLLFVSLFLVSILFISSCAQMAPIDDKSTLTKEEFNSFGKVMDDPSTDWVVFDCYMCRHTSHTGFCDACFEKTRRK